MGAVGIDLGTTNSAVAVLKGRPVIVEDTMGQRTLPSAVGWDPDLEELIVGIDAKNNPHVYGTIRSIKRYMGEQKRVQVGPNHWLPEEVSAEILKVLKKQVEDKSGETVTEAIITVPAYFGLAARDATARAGEIAGLKVQQLLPEPSAAVMAYGPQRDEKILVYDLGGGTFDVTVIDCFAGALTTMAVTGNNFLGGDDFDRRLMDYFLELIKKEHGIAIEENDARAMSQLKKAAEDAKIEMSRKNGARVNIANLVTVGGRPIGLETVVKTAQFNEMIKDLVAGTLNEVEKALDIAKLEKSQIDTILLVGGSTYVPLVQQTVQSFFGKAPDRSVNPDLAVALGAAASVLADAVDDDRHSVSVGFIPENTPDEELDVSGRTTPGSTVRISGGAGSMEVMADEQGEYSVNVPLKKGMNALNITAISPLGEVTKFDPEPVIHDVTAERQEEPPAPPAPILARSLSISHGTDLGMDRYITDLSTVIMESQTELPRQVSNDQFCTNRANQTELEGSVLEGDLPISGLNTKLATIHLRLPPNVPANERVVVHYTVDENGELTAELEVPAVNRRSKVVVDLQAPSEQVHVFEQLEHLYTRIGSKIRPEERATLEQARIGLEDLCDEFRRVREGDNADRIWDTYHRLRKQAERLEDKMETYRRKYA